MANASERTVNAVSDAKFNEWFPNEKAAINWFIYMRYKGNLVCPHCEASTNIYRERKRLKVFHYSHCNNSFSSISDKGSNGKRKIE